MKSTSDSSRCSCARVSPYEHTAMDLPGAVVVSQFAGVKAKKQKPRYSQLVGAVARLVHAMSLFEQLEELFNRNAGVRGPS